MAEEAGAFPDAQRRVVRATELDLNYWHHCEDVAMHFNDLMMRWRLQAIGGMVAITTAAGAVVTRVTEESVARYWAMLLLSILLTFAWVGTASIDLFYYRSLLRGAVNTLLNLEKRLDGVSLSTDIESQAKNPGKYGPWVFYIAGLFPLLVITAYAICRIATVGTR